MLSPKSGAIALALPTPQANTSEIKNNFTSLRDAAWFSFGLGFVGKLGPFLSACRPDSSDGGALESLGMRAVAEHMEAWDRFPGDASALNV